MDLRETAEGVGPQAVPASQQAAPHAFEGQEGEGPRIPMRVPITDRPKKVDSRHLQAIVREINDTPHEGPGLGKRPTRFGTASSAR